MPEEKIYQTYVGGMTARKALNDLFALNSDHLESGKITENDYELSLILLKIIESELEGSGK